MIYIDFFMTNLFIKKFYFLTIMKNILIFSIIFTVTSAFVGSTKDPSTYSNIDEIRTRHLELDINVDF